MFEQACGPGLSSQCVESPLPVRVVDENGALGLVATEPLAEGQLIFVLEGDITRRSSRYSVQVGPGHHLDVLNPPAFEIMSSRYPWRFMNHSCEPTALFENRNVIALRDLAAGERVTFNYNTTEWEMAEPFRCHCGAPGCLGEIRGYKFLSPEARARLGSAAADYLLQRHR